ncbi:cytidine deaminase [Microaceticoccus formicicus]|uniref:cytidine deaminase n=1 Tax=Microaceticoccus formicicus TaxID=3118105 RepID=UPI003CD03ADD|nr:cytidine deaminase [Peptoniphilaceae bacterium AMB_02]
MTDHIRELIQLAIDNIKYSYAPYSEFNVSAVLETATGELYTGVNIENAAYSPTNCAERTAVFKAVSEGHRNFSRIVILGGSKSNIIDFVTPCGVCRQVLVEFTNPEEFEIILAKSVDEYKIMKLSELLPYSFGPSDLE